MFTRIAIVNRGEPAMRLIHAARELAVETDTPLETVALYTDVDHAAAYVREADIAYALGPASARPYLDLTVLERALRETAADAAWVGWGFVAEDPAFAEMCERMGVAFVGPSAMAMRRLGDKIEAKLLAEAAGVPVAPWSGGPVHSLAEATASAERIGYPLMLKAAAGGGGRGIRVVRHGGDLADAFDRTRNEAARAFGCDTVFLERLVMGARHVEVQVIADGAGTTWALGVRDCTIQRRNQKLIEESASPVLGPAQAAEIKEAAGRLTDAVGYQGAATVEFLYDPVEGRFSFLEVNTRLQVEHPVTEATTGFDLVKAQLRIAAGGTLERRPPAERGHAVEARLNAEDPERDFAPAPGRVLRLKLPTGPGIRVDTGVAEGDVISSDFDSMIAKIIATGHDRAEAIGRLRRALSQTEVVVEGGMTNKRFLLDLLGRREVVEATADTRWVEHGAPASLLAPPPGAGVALLAAAIEIYDDAEVKERHRLFSTSEGGRPQVQHAGHLRTDLQVGATAHRVTVAKVGAQRYRVGIGATYGGRCFDVEMAHIDGHARLITVDGARYRVLMSSHRSVCTVEVDGATHHVRRDEGGVVRSPAPALVVGTPVGVGDEVEAGAPVVVLESMKMETVLRAPSRSLVKECLVTVGTQVDAGMPLVRLQLCGANSGASTTGDGDVSTLDVPAVPPGPALREQVIRRQEDLRGRLLGFDVEPELLDRDIQEYLLARSRVAEPSLLSGELEIGQVFADLAELSRSRPLAGDRLEDAHVHSPREFFHSYLQTLDVERTCLPLGFRDSLARTLGHYGVTGLERTPEHEQAVFRIFLAQQRLVSDSHIMSSLLQLWLEQPPPGAPLRDVAARALDSLVTATQIPFPALSELARRVKFSWFEQPILRRTRARVYSQLRGHLRYLEAHPRASDRSEHIDALVESPEPLLRLLGQRFAAGGRDNTAMLEALCRRFHVRGAGAVRLHEAAGTAFATAAHDQGVVVSAAVPFGELPATLDAIGEVGSEQGPFTGDIYVWWPDRPRDADQTAATLESVLASRSVPDGVRSLTFTVIGQGRDPRHQHVTFRREGEGLHEDRRVRGIHPQIAARLQLGRFADFDMTLLPSSDEDIYLYCSVAHGNPGDERLVAFAHVRDLTRVQNSGGGSVAIPAVDDVLAACFDSICRARSAGHAAGPLHLNRIVLYVWPDADISPEELDALADRMAPVAASAALETIVLLTRRKGDGVVDLEESLCITFDGAGTARVAIRNTSSEPVRPLDQYGQKVQHARSRNAVYPYELTDMLGGFVEHDLSPDGTLVPVTRAKGLNTAAIVVGVVSTPTTCHPEGVERVVLLGDPTKSLGALSEPECRRVVAALDLAERMDVPVEWYALSAGARISMESGTENLDWAAAALKRIVEFTQDGGEINIIVAGINVGAQPYWNAEATMLMHTKGILVMTPDSAMVLTGKKSLDYSGGVSAENNFGIGGYDRVMGPNGQAQYWAPNLCSAVRIVLSHYDHTYVARGERLPRRQLTADPRDRDITTFPHPRVEGSSFTTVGDIFCTLANPDRKRPFDIRTVMRAVADQDHEVLERWAGMAGAESAVVQDVRVGGMPVCMLGFESRTVPRWGRPRTDGPSAFTAGTLFPRSSKKAARAINAASGSRPLVVLANLSGFDGSPESMRNLQLEYGAEIGRAVVNFRGPIIICVISRYHGGAFVVFSKALNPSITVLAVQGSYASVLGGAPAAEVVLSAEVRARTAADPRLVAVEARLHAGTPDERPVVAAERAVVEAAVRADKIREVAAEFDRAHDTERAVAVGSIDAVIEPREVRSAIIASLEAGLVDVGRGLPES